jgi:Ion channel
MTSNSPLEDGEDWRARVREPALTVLLAIELLVIFIVIPISGMAVYSLRSMHVPLVSVFAVAVVVAIARRRIALVAAVLAAVVAVAADLFRYESPSDLSRSTFLFAVLAFLFIQTAVVGNVVFGPGRVTAHRIRGAIVLYLHFAMIFTFIYAVVLFYAPGAFGDTLVTTDPSVGGTLLYFSFTTLTTVGYGDVVPVHPFARSIANLEAIVGQLYPATLLARVVTLEITGQSK